MQSSPSHRRADVLLDAMRWSQLTLSDEDPRDLDVDGWLEYFRAIRSDAVCLSAGGYLAYYPTTVPLHRRSQWLGDTDPFGALVRGSRAMGMAVAARTDPHAVHDEAARARPEWIQRDAQGRPRPHWTMPGAWLACMLGPYNFQQMRDIHVELAQKYDIQAIFTNRWKNNEICYCESCRTAVRRECGFDLADLPNLGEKARARYVEWQQDVYLRLVDVWDEAVRAVRSDIHVIPNSGLSRSGLPDVGTLDIKRLMPKVDILFADYQGRTPDDPIWASGRCAKTYHGVADGKPVGGIFSVGLEGSHRWKDSVQSVGELRTWVAESVANGMRPWWTKFAARVPDQRWRGPVGELYRWFADVEPYLRNERSLARVAVAYSQRPVAATAGVGDAAARDDHLQGVYFALLEGRVPFDLVEEEQLCRGALRDYDVVVFPNIPALSDSECGEIERWVADGGGVVATYGTSLCDRDGTPRGDLGLASLFGVTLAGEPEGPMQNSYLELDRSSDRSLLEGISGTERIINGVYRMPVELTEELDEAPLRLIPSYPDLPMEEVYSRQVGPGHPEAICRRRGSGRVLYFPWDIDRTFWEMTHPDHGALLVGAVAEVAARPPAVQARGPGLLDVTVWEQAGSMTVHLVNLTSPMAARGSIRDVLPVGAQTLIVELPSGRSPSRVRLLHAGQTVEPEYDGTTVKVEVPGVESHEILAIDFVDQTAGPSQAGEKRA